MPGSGPGSGPACKERLCPWDEHEAGTITGTRGNGPNARSRRLGGTGVPRYDYR